MRPTTQLLTTVATILLAGPPTPSMANEGEERPAVPGGLVHAVREATRSFQDAAAATAAGYVSEGSCASGPNDGAMGIHYVNAPYIADGILDAQRPEVLVYEQRDGRPQLVAIEFLVDAKQWDDANAGPPVLNGQHFHYVGAPNRLRLPAYYELHVWAWKHNPKGMFADWNPQVSCEEYVGGPGGGHSHGSGR